MASQPLFSLKPQIDPRVPAILRNALLGAALVLFALAFALPYYDVVSPLIGYVLLAVAAADAGLAIALPSVIEKQSAATEYRFFGDRLEISMQGSDYPVAYENIVSVEDAGSARESEHSQTTVALTLSQPVKIPYFGRGTVIRLPGLQQADSPFARIKEVVEKSRRA